MRPATGHLTRYGPWNISASDGGAGGSTLRYLEALNPVFKAVLTRRKDVKLRIVADERPTLEGIAENPLEFIPWSPEVEVGSIQGMSVGLMPLEDTSWARGKCSFKLLT